MPIETGLTSRYEYSPYGESQTIGQDATENPIQYTSRENDRTGLYFYRARYYDPVLKRFISEDPIGLEGGWNIYAYLEGNPVQYIDPLGLFNPAKGASALGNAAIAGFSAASGGLKMAAAVGLSPMAATGIGSLPPGALAAWGVWNMKSAMAAWQRSRQQWREAFCEDWSASTWKNFYGLLPHGTNYDDPGESNNPLEYIKSMGWWRFFAEFGYF